MSFERSDFDHVVRFDNRLLGSVDSAPHTNIGPAPIETPQASPVKSGARPD